MRDGAGGAPDERATDSALEPALAAGGEPPVVSAVSPPGRATTGSEVRGLRPQVATVHVVGLWKRLAAALIDLGIIIPVALILTWIASAVAGVHLPPSRTRGLDFWLDLLLNSDPALVMACALFTAVGLVYLLVFQIATGRTVGMRLLGMRIIDVFGDPPSNARCAVRTLGYLAGAATLLLGFLWIGIDSEKRGLHDWLAGTYVIRE